MTQQLEHQVVVVFDVTAGSRLEAGEQIRKHLVQSKTRLATLKVESWWFPEADLKQIDGNDNAAMSLEHDTSPEGVYVEDDADDEPTIWLHNPTDPTCPLALLAAGNLSRQGRELLWDFITAGLPKNSQAVTR
jgi:hypothetical protein